MTSSRLITGVLERQCPVLENPEFMVAHQTSKALGVESGSLCVLTTSPLAHTEESHHESFPNAIALSLGSKEMKLEAARKMVCVRKARRASSTHAPRVMPRIIQRTIHWHRQKWEKFSQALPKRELATAILRLCPPKKSCGSWPVTTREDAFTLQVKKEGWDLHSSH